jgi:hypothetical protein
MKYYLYANGDIVGSCGKGRPPDLLRDLGKLKKKYSISNSDYRVICSAAMNLARRKKYKLVFLTLTFPFSPTESEANTCVTAFMKAVKRKYLVLDYLWTKERQKNEDSRLHYHYLADMPFIPVKDLESMWESAILHTTSYTGDFFGNSLRFPPGNHTVNSEDALSIAKYIAKYISKERKIEYEKPVFAISRGIRDVKRAIDLEEIYQLIGEFGIKKAYGNEKFSVTMLNNSRKTRKNT